jgi:hypothetical protein
MTRGEYEYEEEEEEEREVMRGDYNDLRELLNKQ